MRLSLVPDRLFRTYNEITPEYLRNEGVKLLLCDLDYTLAPKSISSPEKEVQIWIDSMKVAGIRVMILSNNRSPARVEAFCRNLGIEYVGHAGKPFARGFRQAIRLAGVNRDETAMLGDKLLTDVLCAHFNDSIAIMVEPAGGARTAWQKVLHAMQEPFKNVNRRRNR